MNDHLRNDDLIASIDSALVLPLSQATLDNLRVYKTQIQKGVIQTDDKKYVIALCKRLLSKHASKLADDAKELSEQAKLVVKTYTGSQAEAMRQFQADAINMAGESYFPTSQSWAPGQWSGRAFAVAILLIILFGLGIFILAYMLIVKPDGTLTVTYERRTASFEEKTCPMCAEKIKAAALVCHFCGHKFPADKHLP